MNPWNIGAEIIHKQSVVPILSGAATNTGVAVDRTGYMSCQALVNVGAATGTPDSFTVTAKVQHGTKSDGSDLADYTDEQGNGPNFTVITASGVGKLNLNLRSAHQYVAIVAVVAFVNGTSPKIPVAGSFTLGGAVQAPAA